MTASQVKEFRRTLLAQAARYQTELNDLEIARLSGYYELLLAWNPRLHLVAPCPAAEFATRHVLESLLLLPQLRSDARIADVGSGAGLPIVPVLVARADIRAVIIESSPKKSVFLREALAVTATSAQATVIAERFESIPTPEVNYVTCRALDRFIELFPKLVQWSPQPSSLLLFGGDTLRQQIESAGLPFIAVKVPESEQRFLFVIERS